MRQLGDRKQGIGRHFNPLEGPATSLERADLDHQLALPDPCANITIRRQVCQNTGPRRMNGPEEDQRGLQMVKRQYSREAPEFMIEIDYLGDPEQ